MCFNTFTCFLASVFSYIFKYFYKKLFRPINNHGYEPQSSLWGSYPPLRGIVQLTNFPTRVMEIVVSQIIWKQPDTT